MQLELVLTASASGFWIDFDVTIYNRNTARISRNCFERNECPKKQIPFVNVFLESNFTRCSFSLW